MCDFEWLGHGLLITGPEGSCFMQGEEASSLHDELEAIKDNEILQSVLAEYLEAIDDG